MTSTRSRIRKAAAIDSPRVPVVLPLVEVAISQTGTAVVTVDGSPYDAPTPIERGGLAETFQTIADKHGPVRVYVTECDGAKFTDVVVPDPPTANASPKDPSASAPGITGEGFLPDEVVDLAVIVASQKADSAGAARVRVPPALLAGGAGVVVLVGRMSGAVKVSGPA